MGLLDIFKKSNKTPKDDPSDLIYELLFCDNIELYKANSDGSTDYPWNILFADNPDISELKEITSREDIESRVKILAYNRLKAFGEKIEKKDLLAVTVEVGLENGLDVLAAFRDGTARYINQSGKIIIWETVTEESQAITTDLFTKSADIVAKIGPWNEARRPRPAKGMVRITFLVSDGLYFGEGPMNVLFNDAMAGPALATAAQLMQYLIEKATEK